MYTSTIIGMMCLPLLALAGGFKQGGTDKELVTSVEASYPGHPAYKENVSRCGHWHGIKSDTIHFVHGKLDDDRDWIVCWEQPYGMAPPTPSLSEGKAARAGRKKKFSNREHFARENFGTKDLEQVECAMDLLEATPGRCIALDAINSCTQFVYALTYVQNVQLHVSEKELQQGSSLSPEQAAYHKSVLVAMMKSQNETGHRASMGPGTYMRTVLGASNHARGDKPGDSLELFARNHGTEWSPIEAVC